MFLEPLAFRLHLKNREFRLYNMNYFFIRRRPWRRRRRCLSSLMLWFDDIWLKIMKIAMLSAAKNWIDTGCCLRLEAFVDGIRCRRI